MVRVVRKKVVSRKNARRKFDWVTWQYGIIAKWALGSALVVLVLDFWFGSLTWFSCFFLSAFLLSAFLWVDRKMLECAT